VAALGLAQLEAPLVGEAKLLEILHYQPVLK
jgi:hypothetical protein